MVFVVYFIVSGCLERSGNLVAVGAATLFYAIDLLLFAILYFDILSLAFHIWATVSLVMGLLFAIRKNKPYQEGEIVGGPT